MASGQPVRVIVSREAQAGDAVPPMRFGIRLAGQAEAAASAARAAVRERYPAGSPKDFGATVEIFRGPDGAPAGRSIDLRDVVR